MDIIEGSDTKLNHLRRMSSEDTYQVQAQYQFPSYSSVVEALILNSLQASAREVLIRIDLVKLDIQVVDNGVGTESQILDMIGNTTSETGIQSLSLLSSLCKSLELISKQKDSPICWVKLICSDGASLKMMDEYNFHEGMAVTVKSLFNSLPVRKRSIRQDQELKSILKFVERMSILYHDVSWKIADERNNILLFEEVGQITVAKRLQSIFDVALLSKMKFFHFVRDGYSLKGFLSPPERKFCSSSRSVQSMFYKSTWIKDSDIISITLNSIFTEFFSTSGPTPKHAETDSLCRYPHFFLNFYYPDSCLEIIRDGFKVYPVYHNQGTIIAFLVEFLLCQFSEYPEFCKLLQPKLPYKSIMKGNCLPPNRIFSITPSFIKQSDRDLNVQGSLSLFSFAFLSTSANTAINSSKYSKSELEAEVGVVVHRKEYRQKRLWDVPNKISSFNLEMLQNNLSTPLPTSNKIMLTKDLLDNLIVIAQWDLKYIIVRTLTSNQLLAFDQHACDERIKFERFLSLPIESELLLAPIKLNISKMDYTLLSIKKNLLSRWGFSFTLDSASYQVILKSLPIVADEILTADDFLEFCEQLKARDGLPDSFCQPAAIRRILMSKACRSAIKFGDYLTLDMCKSLIDQLKLCSLPFQCAHGRPSVIPLLKLDFFL